MASEITLHVLYIQIKCHNKSPKNRYDKDILVFCDANKTSVKVSVLLGCGAASLKNSSWTFQPMKIRPLKLSRNVGHQLPVTRRYIPGEWRPQLHRFESLKTRKTPVHLFSNIKGIISCSECKAGTCCYYKYVSKKRRMSQEILHEPIILL
jgi:hypothetical protein